MQAKLPAYSVAVFPIPIFVERTPLCSGRERSWPSTHVGVSYPVNLNPANLSAAKWDMLCAKVRHVLKSCFILITRTPARARSARPHLFLWRRNMIYGSFYARLHLQRRARPPLNIYLLLDWARRKYENGLFDGARQPVTQSAHVKTSGWI
jgi:hypothetical protein